jgi:hypothetical protein
MKPNKSNTSPNDKGGIAAKATAAFDFYNR